MATQILAIGTAALDSADQVVAAGSTLTVCLNDALGPIVLGAATVDILLKDASGQYFRVASLTGKEPATVIAAAGTYRFSRPAGVSCGVFSG